MKPTDLSALEKLAREAIEQTRMFDHSSLKIFREAASPTTILAMIERIRELEWFMNRINENVIPGDKDTFESAYSLIQSLTKANEIMKSKIKELEDEIAKG